MINPVDKSASQARKDAQRKADFYEALDRKPVSIAKFKKAAASLIQEVYGEVAEVPSVIVWFDERYEVASKDLVKAATLRNHKDAEKKFFDFLGKKKELPLDRITTGDIEGFKAFLVARYAPATVNKHLDYVRAVFVQAVDHAVIDFDPCKAVKRAKKRSKAENVRKPFSTEELKRVLEYCNAELKSMVVVSLLLGGQRLGDVCLLKWDQIDFKKDRVSLFTAKTGKVLYVPIVPQLRVVLMKRRFVEGVYVHPEMAALYERRGAGGVSAQFSHALFKAGLIEKDPLMAGKFYSKGKKEGDVSKRRVKNAFSFHSLRYTATTVLHSLGLPRELVKMVVGHDSDSSHDVYIKFGEEAYVDALERLSKSEFFEVSLE